MSDGGFLSNPGDQKNLATLARIRVAGGIRARFHCDRGQSRISDLAESGGYRLLLPASHGSHAEAVQINTGGGIVGGDQLRFDIAVDHGANLVYATQSAERLYRSTGNLAEIDVSLDVSDGARLSWLPQEAILYSGSRVRRRFTANIAGSGRLLLVETIVFGRIASGEQMGDGLLRDIWRVMRDGQLVFADTVQIDGTIGNVLARPAVGGGSRVSSLVLYVAPDAEERLAETRALLDTAETIGGASAWNGILVVRLLANEPAKLKSDLRRILQQLHPSDLPRVWVT